MWYANVKWACVGAVIGMLLVTQAVAWFLGPGGLMPDDRTPIRYGLPIGLPLGGYLGWRAGPSLMPGLRRLLRRH